MRPSLKVAPPADPRMSRAQRWTVWTLRPNPGKKPSKVPVGTINDPSTWSFFPTARACLDEPKIAGLGFMMHGRPEVIGVDIDNCLDEIGTRTPTAAQFLSILEAARTRCHVEISPSGKGLRIFAGETPTPFHDFTNTTTGVEVYTGESPRYLCFTGHQVPGFGEGPFDPLPASAVEWLGRHASKWKEGQAAAVAGTDVEAARAKNAPLPELSRRDDWKDLYPKALKRLSKEHKAFLETGALGDRYGSASEHLFAVEQALLKLLKPTQAYQILISAEGVWDVALTHREGSAAKAKEFLWTDLRRAAKAKEDQKKAEDAESAGWADCGIEVEHGEKGTEAKFLQINIIRSFERHPEWLNRLGYDEFNGVITLDKEEITVTKIAELSAWVVKFLRWSAEPRRVDFLEALQAAAETRTWNPVREFLEGLVWDRRSRLAAFTEAVVAEPEPLDGELLKRWLVGYVARGIEPGCQMDTVLCLRGGEGSFKTSFCRTVALKPEWFGSSPKLGQDQESAILRVGKRILEVGEGVAVSRAGRHELKDDVTRLWEDYRPKYGRNAVRVNRAFAYVLTCNPKAFLRSDQDGLRRFWPIDVREPIDLDWIRENLTQLVAEAVELYRGGTRWWFDQHTEKDAGWVAALKRRVITAVAEDPLDAAVEAVIEDAENKERGYTTLQAVKLAVEGITGITFNAGQMQHLMSVCDKHGLGPIGERRVGGKKIRPWRHSTWAPLAGAKILEMRATPRTAVHTERGEESEA